jgi:hypothetical protein
MSMRILEQGIDAMQAGSLHEGARLIRIALKTGQLEPDMQAIGFVWLAEVEPTTADKRARYQQALAADPGNAEAKARLNRLLTERLPPAAPAAPPVGVTAPQAAAPPAAPAAVAGPVNVAEHLASFTGGPNGPGTGFFVLPDGVLATTRHVVGGLERITVSLHNGRQLTGEVIRSYPALDLAFVRIDERVPSLIPITPLARVPDEAPLFLFHFSGEIVQAAQRPTQRVLPAQWIPTTFDQVHDAGGGPIFDGNGHLVGMMTQDSGRTSDYRFGLHIAAIRASLESVYQELRAEQRVYCPACGALSQAGGAGFAYCEFCGATLPFASQTLRTPQARASVFYDLHSGTCTTCGSGAGLYQGHCLRCGAAAQ